MFLGAPLFPASWSWFLSSSCPCCPWPHLPMPSFHLIGCGDVQDFVYGIHCIITSDMVSWFLWQNGTTANMINWHCGQMRPRAVKVKEENERYTNEKQHISRREQVTEGPGRMCDALHVIGRPISRWVRTKLLWQCCSEGQAHMVWAELS